MPTALALCLVLGAPSLASAAPPSIGLTDYTFNDPVFGSVVVCDSQDDLKAIVSASDPQKAYAAFNATKNAGGIPTCAALPPFTAPVLSTEVLPDLTWSDGSTYHAYAVHIGTDEKQLWVLSLEQFKATSI